MANRPGRIKAVIAKDISEILMFEVKNPHIGMPSVNEVVVNDDYSLAKVYVSFIGSKYPMQNLEELNAVKGVVRSALAKKLDLRKVPELVFIYDDRFEKAESLERALAKEEADIAKSKKTSK